jgi:septal ring factor EnvC (AmiA/AmiB activator)
VNPIEIAINAVEANIQVPRGLLLIAAIAVVTLTIRHVRLRLTLRANRGVEAQLSRSIAAKSEEIARLEARIAEYVELEEGVEELKSEVRRADAIRVKTEERLRLQNAEIEQVRTEAVDRMAELEGLRKLVEHVGL